MSVSSPGSARAKVKGVRLGRRPKYDLDPDEAAQLRAQGYSLREIARRLAPGSPRPQTILVKRALAKAGALQTPVA